MKKKIIMFIVLCLLIGNGGFAQVARATNVSAETNASVTFKVIGDEGQGGTNPGGGGSKPNITKPGGKVPYPSTGEILNHSWWIGLVLIVFVGLAVGYKRKKRMTKQSV